MVFEVYNSKREEKMHKFQSPCRFHYTFNQKHMQQSVTPQTRGLRASEKANQKGAQETPGLKSVECGLGKLNKLFWKL